MDNKEINDVYVDGLRQLLEKNGGRFVVAISLNDDGVVDGMINVHNVSIKELAYALHTFAKEFYEGVKAGKHKQN